MIGIEVTVSYIKFISYTCLPPLAITLKALAFSGQDSTLSNANGVFPRSNLSNIGSAQLKNLFFGR